MFGREQNGGENLGVVASSQKKITPVLELRGQNSTTVSAIFFDTTQAKPHRAQFD